MSCKPMTCWLYDATPARGGGLQLDGGPVRAYAPVSGQGFQSSLSLGSRRLGSKGGKVSPQVREPCLFEGLSQVCLYFHRVVGLHVRQGPQSRVRVGGGTSSFAAIATATHKSGSAFARSGDWNPVARMLRVAGKRPVTVCVCLMACQESAASFCRSLANRRGKEVAMLPRNTLRDRCTAEAAPILQDRSDNVCIWVCQCLGKVSRSREKPKTTKASRGAEPGVSSRCSTVYIGVRSLRATTLPRPGPGRRCARGRLSSVPYSGYEKVHVLAVLHCREMPSEGRPSLSMTVPMHSRM